MSGTDRSTAPSPPCIYRDRREAIALGADPAFWIAGHEFVHCHGEQVEVRVTRGLMTEALSDPRVIRRTRTSDWVQVPISETDLIADLAERAVAANLASLRAPTGRRR